MIKKIDIPAYMVICDKSNCEKYLIIPLREININIGDEIKSYGWYIKTGENGKQYCGECRK